MNHIHCARPLATALLVSSLLGGGVGAAAAAGTEPVPGKPRGESAPGQRALPALTAAPARTTVRRWEELRIEGATRGVLPGTSLTLQQKQGERWVSLPAQTTVRKDGSYVLRAKLGLAGENRLRMVAAGTMSEPFTVTVC